jgi:hypothetical protein
MCSVVLRRTLQSPVAIVVPCRFRIMHGGLSFGTDIFPHGASIAGEINAS